MLTALLLALLVRNVHSGHCDEGDYTPGPLCPIPYPMTGVLTINGDHSCDCIKIEGTLTIESNTYLEAYRIEVLTNGNLIVGTKDSPAEDVVIYLKHTFASTKDGDGPSFKGYTNNTDGKLVSHGVTEMYGKPKTSWTLLNKDCDGRAVPPCNVLSVDKCDNWKVGDHLVVAATGDYATDFASLINFELVWEEGIGFVPRLDSDPRDNYRSANVIIAAVDDELLSGGCSITLDSALPRLYRGEWLDGVVPTQAEVLNLNRSILITGPEPIPYAKHSGIAEDPLLPNIQGFQGITTRQEWSGGHMHIENVRVEKCGRVTLAEYCLHFHYVGVCPDCVFKGNVVTQGTNKGITIHSTHRALVDDNVLYDIHGASMYVEDGNEYENTISRNVLVCPDLANNAVNGRIMAGHRCLLRPGIWSQRDADDTDQAGIYLNSPSNHLIGNHVVGMENAIFLNHLNFWGNMDNEEEPNTAINKVCKLALPFGVTQGNVFHNNNGFGCKCRNKVTQYILFKRLAEAIEVGMVFSNSFEELQGKIACIPAIADHFLLRDILDDLEVNVSKVQSDWLEFQTIYPEIYSAVQTRHALQRMVHVESAFIDDLFQRGLLDEVEYNKMLHHLSQTQHRLYFESFYSVSLLNASNAEKKQTLLSTVFVSKLSQLDLAEYHEKMAFLMNNLGDPRFTAKGESMVKRTQSPMNGLFVLVSGTASILMNAEGADSVGSAEQKQLYLSKGAIIGGYSYLTQRPYLNSIIAKTDCECYFLSNKVLSKLLQNEDAAVELLWKQISSYLILTQFHRNNGSFFAFYEETDIHKTCQNGQYREYGERAVLSIPRSMALLLDGTASNDQEDDVFESPDVLLPWDYYEMSAGSKVLIFNGPDHHHRDRGYSQQTKSVLTPRRKSRHRH